MERLVEKFKPENYKLTLRINKWTEKVQGSVEVLGDFLKNPVKFDAVGLNISEVLVDGEPVHFVSDGKYLILEDLDEASAKDSDNESDDNGGRAEVKSSKGEEKNSSNTEEGRKITVSIKYDFMLSHNMEGIYLSKYEFEGREERIVSTQFESHYAREGFPCIDEPAAKATFDVKIIDLDPEDTILGNMSKKSEKVIEYKTVGLDQDPQKGVALDSMRRVKITDFETTPKMSTYLLAFTIGKLQKTTTKNKHGVEISTYAALNQAKDAVEFPNKIAAEVLDYYDDLFGIPYPLPKLDQVAVPDFEAGAMENWGLVTYRETCLLAGENSKKAQKEYVASVIAHELSHQWFGDLVTMKWWNNLWLNESFANMMQYYSIDKLHPDWKAWQDFFTDDCMMALSRDALPGVQAVQQEVETPEEIATLFDSSIVYAKGARLIFMLMRLMGEDNFFKGIRDYFKVHKYSNTTGDDLWAALQSYADFNVKEFMDAWISQPGYPMVTDGAQQRFLLTGATDDTKWPLPKITDDMSGHYIINLSGPEFDEKIKNFDKLSLEQKLRLLIDRYFLSKTPIVSTGSLMDLVPKFKNEKSEPIFSIIADILSSLKIFAAPDTEYYPKLKQYIYSVIEPNLRRLGYKVKDGEETNDTKLRNLVLGFSIYCEKKEDLEALAEQYNEDFTKIPAETRNVVFDAKFRVSDEAVFDEFLERYKTESDSFIQHSLLSCITEARRPENTKKLFELLKRQDIVRPQNHIYLFSYLLSNFWTRKEAFDWGYDNWEYLKGFTSDQSMDDYVKVMAARVRTIDEFKRFEEFFDPKRDDKSIARSIEVGKTDIQARLRWIHDDADGVHERLNNI